MGGMRARTLCALQAGATAVAALMSYWSIHTIVGTGPVMALAGFGLAIYARRRKLIWLMLFGLSAPLVTSLVALAISGLGWSPPEAERPVRGLLTAYAIVAVALAAAAGVVERRDGPTAVRADVRRMGQFSLRTVLGITTLACALMGMAKYLSWWGDYAMFALYGLGVLACVAAVGIAGARREKGGRPEAARTPRRTSE